MALMGIICGPAHVEGFIRMLCVFCLQWCGRRKSHVEGDTRHPVEIEASLPTYDPFGDYLELLILYGYVTLFVVAFPLAPLLGLINNIVEIRVDSFKLMHECSRPIPMGAEDIGAWSGSAVMQ